MLRVLGVGGTQQQYRRAQAGFSSASTYLHAAATAAAVSFVSSPAFSLSTPLPVLLQCTAVHRGLACLWFCDRPFGGAALCSSPTTACLLPTLSRLVFVLALILFSSRPILFSFLFSFSFLFFFFSPHDVTRHDVFTVSFELCDHNGTGKIQQDDMEQVLISINDTASYFGDPVLKRAQVKVRGKPV